MAGSLAIGALIALATAQGDVQVDASTAWGGKVASSSLTELTIAATADGDAGITVQSVGSSPVTSARLDVRKGEALQVSLPIAAEPSKRVEGRYRVEDGPWQSFSAGRIEHHRGAVVLAGESATAWLGETAEAEVVSAAVLPRAAATYAHVAAVAIDRNALARLDEAQLRALLEFVGVCGRVLLVDPPGQAAELMRQRAGCGGDNLMATNAGPAARPALAALVDQPRYRPPDERMLASMLDARNADVRLMALYLAGFLLVFLLLTRVRRPQGVHLAFCVLATLAAGILWSGGSRQFFVAWAEADATERVARYASLERATAKGRGEQTLQMQSLARSPARISGPNLVLHWDRSAAERRLGWTAPVMQEAQVYAIGSFPVESNLRAGEDAGFVTVCNLGNRRTEPAYLRWDDANYEIPALGPGEHWQVDERAAMTAQPPQLRLLASRSANHSLTLLQPLSVPTNGANTKAWLMRPEQADSEETPCRI